MQQCLCLVCFFRSLQSVFIQYDRCMFAYVLTIHMVMIWFVGHCVNNITCIIVYVWKKPKQTPQITCIVAIWSRYGHFSKTSPQPAPLTQGKTVHCRKVVCQNLLDYPPPPATGAERVIGLLIQSPQILMSMSHPEVSNNQLTPLFLTWSSGTILPPAPA